MMYCIKAICFDYNDKKYILYYELIIWSITIGNRNYDLTVSMYVKLYGCCFYTTSTKSYFKQTCFLFLFERLRNYTRNIKYWY